jgi:hypothetical protein
LLGDVRRLDNQHLAWHDDRPGNNLCASVPDLDGTVPVTGTPTPSRPGPAPPPPLCSAQRSWSVRGRVAFESEIGGPAGTSQVAPGGEPFEAEVAPEGR